MIENVTQKILKRCNNINLIINLSLEGIGNKHDGIRGVKGNFERWVDTFTRLKKLKTEFRNLNVGVHTVISRYNIDDVPSLYQFVKGLRPDSFITEVAEERTELFNLKADITPDPSLYRKTISSVSESIKKDYLKPKGFMYRVGQAFRLRYYELAAQELWRNEQPIPCYAGYASCQIIPTGDVWPCCVLGYDKPMGSLRESGYDFRKIWFSEKADKIREYIRNKNCACPLANAHYTNILCNFTELTKAFTTMI
jgi:MoaA/NifB/PqqE/SkfB family radical SAM enzyme